MQEAREYGENDGEVLKQEKDDRAKSGGCAPKSQAERIRKDWIFTSQERHGYRRGGRSRGGEVG